MSSAKTLLSLLIVATVWITRPDGSLQCDEKAPEATVDPVAAAKAELGKNGVRVLEAKKSNDGQMRVQMCGMTTGNETTFRIRKSDLARAKKLGFELVP